MQAQRAPFAAREPGPDWSVLGRTELPVAGTVQPAIAGYRLLRRLADSRRASVWLAQDLRSGARAALKLAPQASFAREFDQARALAHDNILHVLEHGRAGGVAFLAMEYAEGGPLLDRMGGAVEPHHAFQWIRQAAAGLAQLHRAGLVHRDVKPANCLLRADGSLVLADFGLATRRGTVEAQAREGAVFGTPRYLAPEQAQGAPAHPAADVYSLGVLAYELLCGRPPFAGETLLEVLSQHLVAQVPPLPRSLAYLQPLLESMLAKNPAQRIPDADAVLQALAPANPFPAPAAARGQRWLP